jgi:P pilus assembly chaperone PapD
MRVANQVIRSLIPALFLVTSATGLGGDGLNVTINNNTTKNLTVTVYDLNTNPVVRVLSRQTINGFSSVSVTIAADASAEGHLSWAAITTDTDMRTCSHGDSPTGNKEFV